MTTNRDLESLVNHREAILLAEAIGWLHDYQKCSGEALKAQSANKTNSDHGLPWNKLDEQLRTQGHPDLSSTSLNLLGIAETLSILLNKWDKKWNNLSASFLLQFLSRCHNTSHFDKQDPTGGKQNHPNIQVSSPFGFEQAVPNDLTNQLWNLPWTTLANYSVNERVNIIQPVSKLFTQVGADTRRPINEISLWDWGMLVGALYKAAIAGALLSGQVPQAADLRWRFLSIRVQGIDYITKVARLPDLLSRQELLKDSFDKVRDLLETEYPLGNEVYRDESRSIFVVADLPNLLNFTNSRSENLGELILQEFKQGTLKNDISLKLGGELTPVIELDNTSWWGQDPDYKTKEAAGQPSQDEIPPIGKILTEFITSPPSSEVIKQFWSQNQVDKHKDADICTVCGLRPQGKSDKLSSRKVCDICERRRLDRSQLWATQQAEDTIWIDEVADINGRLALVVGRFDLEDWLNGQLVESLILNPPGSGSMTPAKNPSFSRIRRVWETTRQFWKDVQKDLKNSLSDSRRRLIIHLDQIPNLGLFHVYELELGKTTLSVAWYPLQADGTGGYLISTDNLGYVAQQLQAEKEIFTDPATAAIFVEDYIQSQFVNRDRSITLRDSGAVGDRDQNLLANRRIIRTQHQDVAYSTAIPILTETSTFIALVPADKSLTSLESLNIVKTIKTKYDREMGKVRNRLPLHLGVVYFHRRTPLRVALDAGRQMLNYKSPNDKQLWQVQSTMTGQLPAEKQQLANGTKQFDETITLELTQADRAITWHVPAKMGDGTTEDSWYPYVFLETNGDDSQVNGRQRAIKSQRPGETTPCWLVHAADLREGDQIYFTPSTFDFEFLDTTARRFEIYYDENGRRPRQTRPFYLEDLDRLDILWKILKTLETSQRHQIIHTIEATRETWYGQDQENSDLTDDVFKQFVEDTLANAAWPKDKKWWSISISEADRQQLIQAGVRGELADLAELHMEILKER
jgi:hypothetical protein